MQRRDFLKTFLGLGLLGLTPITAASAFPGRRLLLVELKGGNDGLNTLVPYADPAYYRLRPRIAIVRDKVLKLDEKRGLHPALKPLMASWEAGELALVEGVGYPGPNRSHFRSIEIWEAGGASNQYLDTGWLSRAFSRVAGNRRPQAVVLGGGGNGVFAGHALDSLVMNDPERFLEEAGAMPGHAAAGGNPALAHLLRVEGGLKAGARRLAQGLPGVDTVGRFPRHRLGRDLRNAARLFSSTHAPGMIKVSHGSFDTHANQVGAHQRLLSQLAEGLVAFRSAMQARGQWHDVLVMTYSEFGRRAGENASRGTDHGTAAAHLLLGGQVKGGFYGRSPDLGRLEQGDLVFTTDYRRMYASVAQEWLGVPSEGGPFRPLGCIV